jgi:predicted transcriptional regulator
MIELEKLEIYQQNIYREYIQLLSQKPLTIKEIIPNINKVESIIFRQLKRLRDLGIINKDKNKYCLNENYKLYLNNHLKYEIEIYKDKIKELELEML